ncbi:hypothetical protein B7494_g6477 [Chlorociboria aeruginascens]|nr:hypothetical protein B7494_g6477 [Chlorociboria aeruginascens]
MANFPNDSAISVGRESAMYSDMPPDDNASHPHPPSPSAGPSQSAEGSSTTKSNSLRTPVPIVPYSSLSPAEQAAQDLENNAAVQQAQEEIDIDSGTDAQSDAGYETDSVGGSASTSLTSGVRDYAFENGRRYHRFREGAYNFPNDDSEQDREDMKHAMMVNLCQTLHFAPIGEHPQNVLDMGTGTGIWAIEMGDLYPGTNILGVDLSPIQPDWVPPNVKFMVDDVESPWLKPYDFYDYVHARHTVMAIKNWPELMKRVLDHVKPGGWFELQEMHHQPQCHDGSMPPDHAVAKYWALITEALGALGVDFNATLRLADMMREAGFVNITTRIFHVPIGVWPKNKVLKMVGLYWRTILIDGLQPIALGPMTRGLKWSKEEVECTHPEDLFVFPIVGKRRGAQHQTSPNRSHSSHRFLSLGSDGLREPSKTIITTTLLGSVQEAGWIFSLEADMMNLRLAGKRAMSHLPFAKRSTSEGINGVHALRTAKPGVVDDHPVGMTTVPLTHDHTSSLIALAATISKETEKLQSYFQENGIAQPGFDVDSPLDLPKLPEDIKKAREEVMRATKELGDLITGPRESLRWMAWDYNDNLSLHAIYHYKIATSFPLNSTASFAQIAEAVGLDEVNTRRFLRHAMTNRIFKEVAPGVVAHTAASRILAEDQLMGNWVGLMVEEFGPAATKTIPALVAHPEATSTMRTGFCASNGTTDIEPMFATFSRFPERAKRFGGAMTSLTSGEGYEISHLVENYDWDSLDKKGATIVDLGGSHGPVCIELAQRFKNLRFVVQDLEGTILSAPALGVYLFRWILHNQSTPYALKMLRALIPALRDGSRIIINDHCLPEPNTETLFDEKIIRTMDLVMLTLLNSQERTEAEFKELFEMVAKNGEGGFRFVGVKRPEGCESQHLKCVFELFGARFEYALGFLGHFNRNAEKRSLETRISRDVIGPAHAIKNNKSKISLACQNLKPVFRWGLTAFQNDGKLGSYQSPQSKEKIVTDITIQLPTTAEFTYLLLMFDSASPHGYDNEQAKPHHRNIFPGNHMLSEHRRR